MMVADAAAHHAVQAGDAGRPQDRPGRPGSYMVIAMVMVIVRIIQMAIGH
jgi:hypothetical protein